jgi:hypothetical protein
MPLQGLDEVMLTQIDQDRCNVPPRRGYLRSPAYAQGPRQYSRCPCCQHNAPPDNADWATAICAQKSNWYMDVALPAGDAFVHLVRLALGADFPSVTVYNLVSVGLVRRDTACGLSFSNIWLYSTHSFAGHPSSRFE